MADDNNPNDNSSSKTEDAVSRIFINADMQRVCRELTITGQAQGAVFNAWLHTNTRQGLVPGARLQMRTCSGGHVIVDGDAVVREPASMCQATTRIAAAGEIDAALAHWLRQAYVWTVKRLFPETGSLDIGVLSPMPLCGRCQL